MSQLWCSKKLLVSLAMSLSHFYFSTFDDELRFSLCVYFYCQEEEDIWRKCKCAGFGLLTDWSFTPDWCKTIFVLILWFTLSSYLSPQCLQCYNCPSSHSSRAWWLKHFSSLFITPASHAEHTVDHSHEINVFVTLAQCTPDRDGTYTYNVGKLW